MSKNVKRGTFKVTADAVRRKSYVKESKLDVIAKLERIYRKNYSKTHEMQITMYKGKLQSFKIQKINKTNEFQYQEMIEV